MNISPSVITEAQIQNPTDDTVSYDLRFLERYRRDL